MDMFKLLSRSTKLQRPSVNTSTLPNIPSSGQNANPQLFGHEVPVEDNNAFSESKTSLGKRKRHENDQDTQQPKLDFFEERKGKSKQQKQQSGLLERKNDHSWTAKLITTTDNQVISNNTQEQNNMNLEERKRILRSHKIKISVFSGLEQHTYG